MKIPMPDTVQKKAVQDYFPDSPIVDSIENLYLLVQLSPSQSLRVVGLMIVIVLVGAFPKPDEFKVTVLPDIV